MKRIGWCGIVDDEPYFEPVTDGFSLTGQYLVAVDVFKLKKEAKKRFVSVCAVYIEKK
jgi:hypothetical protein